MHELGIIVHINKTLHSIAQENQLTKIGSVTLEIGEVSTIVPEYLMDKWKPLCEKYDCTIANLALGWILAQGDFLNLLSGSTTVEQIKENVKSAELELDPEDVAYMRELAEEIDK